MLFGSGFLQFNKAHIAYKNSSALRVMFYIMLALAGVSPLTGCVVGPDYKPDDLKIPAQFRSIKHPATKEEIAKTEKLLTQWWAQFHDPVLNDLVKRALKGNYDLQAATQRIIAEQAVRRQAQAQWYPQLDANAGGGNDRHSIIIDNWPVRPGNPANHPSASMLTYGVRANWEIDIFGRIARDVEAHKRLVEETIEERRGVLITLLSQLVSDYIGLRETQERLDVVENSVKTAHQSTVLVTKLYQNGVGNNLTVAQAQAEEHTEKSRIPELVAQQARLIHAIAILMGELPSSLEPELEARQKLPIMPAFPETVPSVILQMRPDIGETERRYAENMARIGVAIAQLYPNFSIPLTFNPNASALSQAFQIQAMSWNVLMMMSVPVLHGGKYDAAIMQARAEAEASRLEYRQTVLNAFREVEDAFIDWEQDEILVKERQEAANQAVLARQRAGKLFNAGLTGYLDVLNTQQNALTEKEAAVKARGKRLDDAVTLYIAFGAGWQGQELQDTRLAIEKKGQTILERAFER